MSPRLTQHSQIITVTVQPIAKMSLMYLAQKGNACGIFIRLRTHFVLQNEKSRCAHSSSASRCETFEIQQAPRQLRGLIAHVDEDILGLDIRVNKPTAVETLDRLQTKTESMGHCFNRR